MKKKKEIDWEEFVRDALFNHPKFWYSITAFNLLFLIVFFTLEATYESVVCCCGCTNSTDLMNCFAQTGGKKIYIPVRWGGLYNCTDLCKSQDLDFLNEISLETFMDYMRDLGARTFNVTLVTNKTMI